MARGGGAPVSIEPTPSSGGTLCATPSYPLISANKGSTLITGECTFDEHMNKMPHFLLLFYMTAAPRQLLFINGLKTRLRTVELNF